MTRIGIIGAGFGGLAAAIELKRVGHDDIVIFEKADEVGGVWRENTYPGAACDVPSPFYSFSFEPNPHWPKRFSPQPVILGYLKDVADKYDVRRHIRFGVEVAAAEYDEAGGRWSVTLGDGTVEEVDVLVPAVGQLSRPRWPAVPGRERFAGPSFHSAEWDHTVDLAGKRVAVIGTGASAAQFIPAIQPEVGQLTVFQRSAPYILPRPDTTYAGLHKRIFDRVPATQLTERVGWYAFVESLSVAWVYAKPLAAAITRASRLHMKRQTGSAELFEKVWPDYPAGCKRILFSSDYLPALAQKNVDVVTGGVTEITETGVVAADGATHDVDVIIYGTGFTATDFLAPMQIRGLAGKDLNEQWSEGARAYYGMTIPHFPNLFLMYGPNTNTGGGSIVFFHEVQAAYLRRFVDHLVVSGAPLVVRDEVEQEYDDRVQSALADSVWSACTSWYRGPNGRVSTNWPWLGIQYKQQAKFDPADYDLVPTTASGAPGRHQPSRAQADVHPARVHALER
ncbi:flavin-containing monooxygenase [Nocardioides speluncae]|uniref:flavin-containing monooxygenase n=1 Tax=Nocardioides speluncae TaxID=2670337 RepID=UPI000D69DA89|nr:NAD(P)/FAD-dependent oxidoreductase [Nocardioides speluncae]